MTEARLRLSGVRQTFRQGEAALEVLRGVDLQINAGEIVALVGPSGSGKSTLLQIAGLLERAEAGEVEVAGKLAGQLGDDARTKIRREELGFVYQYHHLLPEFSALENVIVPQMIAGRSRKLAAVRAKELLALMHLTAREEHRPARLSGGEQQRVAICRALANQPSVLLADEPTGNLDPQTAAEVFALLLRLVHDQGVGALIATHNPELAGRMDRTLRLDAGKIAL